MRKGGCCDASPTNDHHHDGSDRCAPDGERAAGERVDDRRHLAHERAVRQDDRRLEVRQRWVAPKHHPGDPWLQRERPRLSLQRQGLTGHHPNAPSLNPNSQTIAIRAHVKFNVMPPPSVADCDLVRKGSGIYKMEILDNGPGLLQVPRDERDPHRYGRAEPRGWHVAHDHPQDVVGNHPHSGWKIVVAGRQRRSHLEQGGLGSGWEAERVG